MEKIEDLVCSFKSGLHLYGFKFQFLILPITHKPYSPNIYHNNLVSSLTPTQTYDV
jgi:hypothetical protein